jgi:hypothetical protein
MTSSWEQVSSKHQREPPTHQKDRGVGVLHEEEQWRACIGRELRALPS